MEDPVQLLGEQKDKSESIQELEISSLCQFNTLKQLESLSNGIGSPVLKMSNAQSSVKPVDEQTPHMGLSRSSQLTSSLASSWTS